MGKNKNLKDILIVSIMTVLPVVLVFLPFMLKLHTFFFLQIKDPGMFNVFRNWDGPNFLMVTRTWYNMDAIGKRLFLPQDPRYFAAHFPLYPVLIAVTSVLMNTLYAAIVVNIVFGLLLNILFFHIAKRYTKHPYFLTFVFTVFPARYLVLRSIIAAETLMLFCILMSLYLWEKKQYFWSSILGFFGVLAKVQTLFLFPAFAASVVEKKIKEKQTFDIRFLWMFMIPLAFVALSFFYYFRMADFLAYFHAEKGNNLSVYFPFAQFNYNNAWSGVHVEDIVFYFVAMFSLIFTLWQRKERIWFYFALFYSSFLIFLPHGDIARYAYPLLPMFLLTFESFFTSKPFKWAFIICLPAIYFFAVNFMLVNQAPIADWSLLLK